MSTLVLTNARVITCDDHDTVAEAVAVRGGRVLAVGGSETVRAQAGTESHTVDLAGSTVIPRAPAFSRNVRFIRG